jgi:hypothetical protein
LLNIAEQLGNCTRGVRGCQGEEDENKRVPRQTTSHALPQQGTLQREPESLTPDLAAATIGVLITKLVDLVNKLVEGVGVIRWELDLWYEVWNRAGSEGLDTWYELGAEAGNGRLEVSEGGLAESDVASDLTVAPGWEEG